MQSRSGKQTSLVPIPPSFQSTSAVAGLIPPPLVASQEDAPTSVDCGTQRRVMTSVECLHEYARWAGRYPKLGLFTTDLDGIVGPPSPDLNPTSESLPAVSTDLPFCSPSMDDCEDAFEDDDDDEYRPARQTIRPLRPVSPEWQAGSSRVSPELPANTRRRKRAESPNGDEGAKRAKSDPDPSTSTPRPSTSTTHETDPKTGKQFIVVRDKKGKVLQYRCPDHPDLNCNNRGDMGRHLQSRDHQQPSYRCVDSCGRKFTRIDALKRHVYNANLHPKGSLVVVEHERGAKTYLTDDHGRKKK